jgi:hypothetical protein
VKSKDPYEPNPIFPLADFGIRWHFYVRAADVLYGELDLISKQHGGRIPWAYTFGNVIRAFDSESFVDMTDPELLGYNSTTTVHLWRIIEDVGSKHREEWGVTLKSMNYLVWGFTHETLHHAIGRCMAEFNEYGTTYPNKEEKEDWIIDRLLRES